MVRKEAKERYKKKKDGKRNKKGRKEIETQV